MSRRVVYGALAAAFGSYVALDTTTFAPAGYPLLQKLFDGDAIIVRNLTFALASAGTAAFAYLATTVKDGDPKT